MTAPKIDPRHLSKHETKREVLVKFLLIVAILVIYFLFVSNKFGVKQGFLVTALTWSFFVLCTPIADAGFLIDFPMRLVTNIRMSYIEVCVWLLAITLNIYAFFFNSQIYATTSLLNLFQHILEQPFPFWGIILISMTGTFVSIRFGDELLDKVKHSQRKLREKHQAKYKLIIMIFLFAISLVFYDFLLKKLGISLPF